jgi:hypothetical protein
MKRISILTPLCLFVLLPAAHGQLGIYAGFTASNSNIPNENWFYGPTFGAYYNVVKLPVIKLGLDGRAAILSASGGPAQQKIVNGLAGPRLEAHLPLIPLKPYVEGYAGASKVEVGQGSAYSDKTVLGYGFAAGADLTIFPRLDWRVAEYSYTRSNVFGNITQDTVTTGLVLRLPVP